MLKKVEIVSSAVNARVMENYGAFVEGISLVSDLQTNLTVIDINLDAVDIRSLANPDYFPGHHVALLSPQ